MSTSARLVDLDGTELLRFGNAEAIVLELLTLNSPDDRESVTARTGRDGTNDTTHYHGAAAITAQLAVRGDATASKDVWLDRLRGYVAPNRRAWLHITRDGWAVERRVRVRGVRAPVTFDWPGWHSVQVAWVAPDGVYESTVPHTQTLFPSASGGEGGVSSPLSSPFSFDPGNVPGSALLANDGTTDAWLTVDIYGLCTNPVLKNLTSGRQIGFTGLTVQAGEFLRLDMREMTALLSNVASQSRYGLLDFTTSSWWPLQRGTSQVAFVASNPGVTCQAQLTWPDTMI